YVPKAVRAPSMMTISFTGWLQAAPPLPPIVPLGRFGRRRYRGACRSTRVDVLRGRAGAGLLRLLSERADLIESAVQVRARVRGAVAGRGKRLRSRWWS